MTITALNKLCADFGGHIFVETPAQQVTGVWRDFFCRRRNTKKTLAKRQNVVRHSGGHCKLITIMQETNGHKTN